MRKGAEIFVLLWGEMRKFYVLGIDFFSIFDHYVYKILIIFYARKENILLR